MIHFGYLVSRSAIYHSATITHQVTSPLLLSQVGANCTGNRIWCTIGIIGTNQSIGERTGGNYVVVTHIGNGCYVQPWDCDSLLSLDEVEKFLFPGGGIDVSIFSQRISRGHFGYHLS